MYESKSALAWGRTVEILRSLRDWRQAELAQRADVSLSALSGYETGQREPPDTSRAAIERALGVAGWMEEAQLFLGYLRRAMERPFEGEEFLGQEAREKTAQLSILLRAGMAPLPAPGEERPARRTQRRRTPKKRSL